jgi:hypothetical protein
VSAAVAYCSMRPSTTEAGDEKDVALTPATAQSVLSIEPEKERYADSNSVSTTTQLEDVETAYANGPPGPTTPTAAIIQPAKREEQGEEGQEGPDRKHTLLIVASLCVSLLPPPRRFRRDGQ